MTSTVNGDNPGSRPRWSMHTSWTTPQSDNRALLFLDNNGLSWTVSTPDKVTAVPVRRNGNFQTPISVPVVRPKRCHTLSNPAHRQDYTVACLNYTLQTMMPLPGWPVMARNAHDNNNNNGWQPAYRYCQPSSTDKYRYMRGVQNSRYLGDQSFTVAGPCLWNNLPLQLGASELPLLKCCWLLKMHAFCWWSWHLVTNVFKAPYKWTYLPTC